MTKLNHRRPSLRYLDNFRREIRKAPTPIPDWYANPAAKKLLPETDMLPSYMQEFAKLSELQRLAMGRVIEAFARFQETVLADISELFSKNKKKRQTLTRARDEAHGFLVVLGAAMFHQIIRDAANGSAALLQWYLKFVGGLDHRTRLAWSELDYVLTEESLPLYEAWLTNEETEEAAVLGRVLKDVSWQ